MDSNTKLPSSCSAHQERPPCIQVFAYIWIVSIPLTSKSRILLLAIEECQGSDCMDLHQLFLFPPYSCKLLFRIITTLQHLPAGDYCGNKLQIMNMKNSELDNGLFGTNKQWVIHLLFHKTPLLKWIVSYLYIFIYIRILSFSPFVPFTC